MEGKPQCVLEYCQYVFDLGWTENPDYERMKELFSKNMQTQKDKDINEGLKFDWQIQKEEILKKKHHQELVK